MENKGWHFIRIKDDSHLKTVRILYPNRFYTQNKKRKRTWSQPEKPYLLTCTQTETKMSLHIHAVWSELSLFTTRNFASLAIPNAPSEDSDPTDLNLCWAPMSKMMVFEIESQEVTSCIHLPRQNYTVVIDGICIKCQAFIWCDLITVFNR